MRAVFRTKNALQIARELLEKYEPPIAAFIREDDFKKLHNKEHVDAVTSFTKEWTIGELRSKKVLFVTYRSVLDVLPIEANWELFMGNKSVVYIEIMEGE